MFKTANPLQSGQIKLNQPKSNQLNQLQQRWAAHRFLDSCQVAQSRLNKASDHMVGLHPIAPRQPAA